MPSDTVYVSILRDPVTMFESIFTYVGYRDPLRLQGNDPIANLAEFLTKPHQYYDSVVKMDWNMKRQYVGHMKNPMLYDFGLSIANKDNQSLIDGMIRNLTARFDLLMITEYIHESLILLKDLLCWSLDDIVFFSLNARTRHFTSQISPKMAEDIRNWNQGDFKLYNHFNQTFWKKVERFGLKRMKREVSILKEYNKYLFNLCIEDVGIDPNVWHPPGINVNSLQVKPTMRNNSKCVNMATPELDYTAKLQWKLLRRKYNIENIFLNVD